MLELDLVSELQDLELQLDKELEEAACVEHADRKISKCAQNSPRGVK